MDGIGVRFRGTLRWLANTRRMGDWLHRAGVLLKDLREYAMGLTDTIRQESSTIQRPNVTTPK